MISDNIKNLSFDDILYQGLDGYLKKNNSMPSQFINTNEHFLETAYYMYKAIENNDCVFFNKQKSETGFTSALSLIVCYLALNNKEISIISKPGSYKDSIFQGLDMFNKFINTNFEVSSKANEFILKDMDGDVYCNIGNYNNVTFNVSNLKGIVIFDSNTSIRNIDKFNDIFKNGQIYDKLIIYFPNNNDIVKLAEENGVKYLSKDIKIF